MINCLVCPCLKSYQLFKHGGNFSPLWVNESRIFIINGIRIIFLERKFNQEGNWFEIFYLIFSYRNIYPCPATCLDMQQTLENCFCGQTEINWRQLNWINPIKFVQQFCKQIPSHVASTGIAMEGRRRACRLCTYIAPWFGF